MILNIVSYFIYIVYICQWKADFLFFILKKTGLIPLSSPLLIPFCFNPDKLRMYGTFLKK